MLLDAYRAETYRLARNRTTVFWSLLFVPITFLIGSLGISLFLRSKIDAMSDSLPGELAQQGPQNIVPDLFAMIGGVDNWALMGFVLIGAATLFAGDYRWESWRLISARNSRLNLLLAKVLAVVTLCLVATMLFAAAGKITVFLNPLINGRDILLSPTATEIGQMWLVYLLKLAHLVQFTLLSLLAATVTRSLLAALFIPIVISIAQGFVEKSMIFLGIMPNDWRAIITSPSLATNHLSDIIQNMDTPLQAGTLWPSLASLAVWIIAPILLSLLLFSRQGLSKE